jgi:hypothetical protein
MTVSMYVVCAWMQVTLHPVFTHPVNYTLGIVNGHALRTHPTPFLTTVKLKTHLLQWEVMTEREMKTL